MPYSIGPDFAGGLRILRELRGWSQRELARHAKGLGLSTTQARISQWERGTQLPGVENLFGVLESLGASLCDLERAMDCHVMLRRLELETGSVPLEHPSLRVLLERLHRELVSRVASVTDMASEEA
jgi:transcriptional regulator with XRE-family HTH domain